MTFFCPPPSRLSRCSASPAASQWACDNLCMSDVADIQALRKRWAEIEGPCVVCGSRPPAEKDHIPPRALFPKALRDPTTEFLTYPVCTRCNRGSSDSDFLLAFRLAAQLNQENYVKGVDPADPDLLELDLQITRFLTSKNESRRRKRLLSPRVRDGVSGLGGVSLPDSLVMPSLLKMARALYWLKTDGDVLENHKPAWWVRSGLDTSTSHFSEHILGKTQSSVQWRDRFITRYNFAGPESSVPGTLMAAFIFYSKGLAGGGYTWFVLSVPSKFELNGELMQKAVERIHGSPSQRYRSISGLHSRRK